MTGMEYAIDRAANLRAAAEACLEDRPADPNAVELAWLVIDALGSGLLAPAPLTEEWGIWGEDDAGDWELGDEFKCREEAEQFMEKNPWTREKGGYLVRRPVHDWEPVHRAEGDGRADQ